MIPFHRGTETARRAGVDDRELAQRRLAGQDWCSKHDDGTGAFVSAGEMSSVPNQCTACLRARSRAARHARKQRRCALGQDAGR